ncbi:MULTISPECIES: hypothetical protein [Polymorphospora]|uniref:AtuA-like ferredoxin-fold domain-containing protein n=1 Tax=Polymorphospora lycopeni TaxID=3140240 RepID=A0ABV5CMX8_9ACTN
MKVRDIAYARCGDKGDSNNICVFVYDPEHYPLLAERLTVARVGAAFGGLVAGDVVRYDIPSNHGLNFVLTGSLRGGVSMSLRTDPHGKAYASLLLGIEL